MKPINVAALAGVLVASLSLAATGATDEPADGLVYDAMAAPSTVSFTGTVQVVRIGNQHSQASVYRIEHRAPGLTRRSYLSPSSLTGDSIVTRGDESFSIDTRRGRVVATKNDALDDRFAIANNYILLRRNYRAEKQAAESFDGRTVDVVALVNNYTHRTTMVVRIDQQTKLVLDKQEFAADGSLVSETRYQEVRYGDSIRLTDFDVPKRLALVRGPNFGLPSNDPDALVRRAGFPARGPRFLPDGFSPAEGNIVEIKGVRTLHLLYSDGIRTVSLFENVKASALDVARLHPQSTTVAGRNATYAEDGPTTLLYWNDGKLYYTLLGELKLDELQRIASSV